MLFESFEIKQAPLTQNIQVDALSKLALAIPSQVEKIVYFKNQPIPSIANQKLLF